MAGAVVSAGSDPLRLCQSDACRAMHTRVCREDGTAVRTFPGDEEMLRFSTARKNVNRVIKHPSIPI